MNFRWVAVVLAGGLVPEAVLQADPGAVGGLELGVGGPAEVARIVGPDDVAVAQVPGAVLGDQRQARGGPVEMRDAVALRLEVDDHVVRRLLVVLRVVGGTVEAVDRVELRVLGDDDLAREPVGMVEDPPDQAAQHVGVRAAALRPLVVDLDHDRVIRRDDAIGTRRQGCRGGPVELRSLGAHDREQLVEAGEAVAHGIRRAVGLVEQPGAVLRRGRQQRSRIRRHRLLQPRRGSGEVIPEAEGQGEAENREHDRPRQRDARVHPAANPDDGGNQRRAEGERRRRERGLLAGVGPAARLAAAAQDQPGEGGETGQVRARRERPVPATARPRRRLRMGCE